MIRSLARSVAWILAGGGIAGLLFWALINTPESTVVALAASVFLAVALVAVIGVTMCGALAGWQTGWQRSFPRSGFSGLAAFVTTLAAAILGWWAIGLGLAWLDRHAGEITAWFIARANWSNVAPLLNGVRLVGEWLRWLAVPFAGLVWLSGALATRRWRPSRPKATLARAASLSRLAKATAIALVTIWVPMTYGLYWRPALLPTWLEPIAAVAKLGTLAIVAAAGLSLVLRLAAAAEPGSDSQRG